MTPAVTHLPPLSRGALKPEAANLWQEEVLPARTALAVWIGLSAVGWGIFIGLGYWIF